MKRLLLGLALCGLFAILVASMLVRRREERADRRMILLVDWAELRDAAGRLGLPDADLLKQLKTSGADALLISPSTVQDYLWNGFLFPRRATAERVLAQLSQRGVQGLSIRDERGGQFRLLNSLRPWERLKDLETGYDPELLDQADRAGLRLVLRVNQDPWIPADALFSDLKRLTASHGEMGFVLNTDEVPGGKEALPRWRSFLADGNLQLLFEFHPSKSTMKLAYGAPTSTWRAHTIAPNELKDLTPAQQRSRWRRAVEERSCRFLLLHAAPGDTPSGYLQGLTTLREYFQNQGWIWGWPAPRSSWSTPGWMARQVTPWLALLTAIFTPLAALRLGWGKKTTAGSFATIFLVALLGASLTAALADNALTRVEIMPFRGIKAAFLLGWMGSFLSLFSFDEFRDQVMKTVRRFDLLCALAAAALIAYVMIRMGNASAGWKPGWEQGVRDGLENLLIARPRFKEFAIGYPLLLLGLETWRRAKARSFWLDGRFCAGVGMMAPASMVNTFCHLHSPLMLAFWRSLNGLALGALIGMALIAVQKRGGAAR
jgi:hypothetical protein